MKRRSAIAWSLAAGVAITGIGFVTLLLADPDEINAPLAVKITAPIPVISGGSWVDQFAPMAWILNAALWTIVVYAILGPWPSVKRLFFATRAKLAAKWRLLTLPVIAAASFAIYWMPLRLPMAQLQWRWFLRDMFKYRDIYPTSLVLAESAFAVGTQLAAVATMLWVLFGRRAARFLLPIPMILFVLLAVPRLVPVEIPIFFLSSPDTASSKELSAICTCAGWFADLIQQPVDVHMDEPWLAYGALLQAPGCQRRKLDLRAPMSSSDFAVPGGRVVFMKADEHQHYQWWYYGGPGSKETRLASPEDWRDRILSSDGESVAWLDWDPERRGPPSQVILTSLAGKRISAVRLPPLSGRIRLLTVNRSADRIILRTIGVPEPGKPNTGAGKGYYEIGFDGRKHWGPWNPVDAAFAERDGLRLVANGWVVWNAGHRSSMRGTQRIAWCLAKQCGGRTVHKGREIHSVDVDGDGRFIAVAERAWLPAGRLSGTVYVFDVQTGSEVFRRYLKKWSRPVVRLLQRGFFAYSDEVDESISVFALPKT